MPEPDAFTDTFVAMTAARAIVSATRLGVVDALADAPATAAQVSERLGLELYGVEALLGALATLGYLDADANGAYTPTSAGRTLIAGTPDSVSDFIGAYNEHAWEMLGRLDETLRDARAAQSHSKPPGDPFWEPYIRGLFELSRSEHDDNAALVPVDDPRKLLDIAGGHGAFAMAMCRRFPALEATVLDLPASVEVGSRIVAEEGFADRVVFREGDATRDDLGDGLDVVSMFNLLHHLPAEVVADLMRRVRAALRTGGCLVIGETERTEPGQTPSLNGAMSGLVYFASSGTRNYTQRELVGWLEQAGFARIDVHRNEHSPWRLLYVAVA